MLSVVIPAYEAAAQLPACIAALRRAAPDAELLVVDDGSTDDTARAAAAAGATVVRHDQNRGTSAARNTGWRAARGDLVLFVDADVVVEPGAVDLLLTALAEHPEALGANGTLLVVPLGDVTSDFVNASLHYQLRRHGPRGAAAFTSICLLRRQALEQMGGWEDRWHGRYADDVVTRFHLPPGSLLHVAAAAGRHDKRVPLRGLLRHRFWIGWFWVASAQAHRDDLARAPELAVQDTRYPRNCALAALTLVVPVLAPLTLPAILLSNAGLSRFMARTLGLRTAVGAAPIGVLEPFPMVLGVLAGVGSAALRQLRGGAAPRESQG